MENIVLIGMPSAGKSTAGVLLAKLIGYGFIDCDLMIQAEEGMRLADIIKTKGTGRLYGGGRAGLFGRDGKPLRHCYGRKRYLLSEGDGTFEKHRKSCISQIERRRSRTGGFPIL